MKINPPPFLKSYGFSILLIASILVGATLGILYQKDAARLKPLGDLFLNLLFTVIIPLIFFSISSTVASMTNLRRLGKILFVMMLVFVITGLIASAVMMAAVIFFPPASGVNLSLAAGEGLQPFKAADQIVRAFSVPDFPDLLSKNNMLALIIFSMLVGVAASAAGEKGKDFTRFLASANAVMMKLISFIMYYAPIGLCAYFAYLVGVFGPELLGSYARAMAVYYPTALSYFFIAFTFYAYLAGRGRGIKTFWSHIIPPSVLSLATGSSMATIPASLRRRKKSACRGIFVRS